MWRKSGAQKSSNFHYIQYSKVQTEKNIYIYTDSNEKNDDLGMVAHAFNPSAGKEEAGRSLWVQVQPALHSKHSEFQ